MIEWLTDTLFATGALMALVLVLRRPVARWFGSGAAYALWALPMIRLVLPPLALPRGLLPKIEFGVEPLTAAAAGRHMAAPVEMAASVTSPAGFTAGPAAELPAALPLEPGLLEQVPWTTVALTVWLGGAVLFLVWRTVTYRWMRRDLLEGARLVAHSGAVRIVETPAINAPLAFGVSDKVIALPMGFLGTVDSETSDFAIAHEMEHHAGGDLLALIAMQPLFALHWFNPIGWAGWRAVRGDQEAACDARVMAGRSRAERASYGRLIASLAGGTRLGLAAPMAGPLSGDKPIIHRLKALARKDVTPARRLLARSLFAMAIVTVPATATVSYAAMDEPDAPNVEPPVPPVPPVPAAVAEAPEVPEAPQAPESIEGDAPPAPSAPEMGASRVVIHKTVVRDTDETVREAQREADRRAADAGRRAADAANRAADADRLVADAQRMAADAIASAPRVVETVSADGRRRTVSITRKDGANGTVVLQHMVIDEDCPADQRREARAEGNGSKATVVICTGEPKAAKQAAVNAIRTARASIAANRALDTQVRAEILADLDREIADAQREVRGT